jgi:YHS domain-containing protein
MRLLIIIGVAYLAYRALKSWMLQNVSTEKTVTGETTGEIDDVMIKDPFCQVYFPKRNGVHLKADGEDLYFCSKECRDRFIEVRNEK